MDSIFAGYIKDLSEKSERSGRYFFTHFLSPAEQSDVGQMRAEINRFKFFGGADMTERNMARFGDENDMGWEQDFPIKTIRVSPLNAKFSDSLTHRDFLGAIMNLGIERDRVGDIVVRDNNAFIFIEEKMADYVCENLNKVKHTDVKCAVTNEIPDGELYSKEEKSVIVSSKRIDCVTAGVFNLSRNEAQKLIENEKVFINSKTALSVSKELTDSDVISVRGYGKFKLISQSGTTKKGRLALIAEIYK